MNRGKSWRCSSYLGSFLVLFQLSAAPERWRASSATCSRSHDVMSRIRPNGATALWTETRRQVQSFIFLGVYVRDFVTTTETNTWTWFFPPKNGVGLFTPQCGFLARDHPSSCILNCAKHCSLCLTGNGLHLCKKLGRKILSHMKRAWLRGPGVACQSQGHRDPLPFHSLKSCGRTFQSALWFLHTTNSVYLLWKLHQRGYDIRLPPLW